MQRIRRIANTLPDGLFHAVAFVTVVVAMILAPKVVHGPKHTTTPDRPS